jgi:DNA-binding transcriptional ArsR family regulator
MNGEAGRFSVAVLKGPPDLLAKLLTKDLVKCHHRSMVTGVTLLEDSGQVRAALSPLRRELLDLLHQPASASELGARLGLPRQKINYHLGVLEQAGLLRLVETRARRGCTERILQATASEFVVDPQLMGQPRTVRSQDRFAADHLIQVAAETVRGVSRQQAEADRAQRRLLTFTIEAEVSFAQPADVHRFTDVLAEAVRSAASDFAAGTGGQRYRVVIGGHPAPARRSE